MDEKDAVYLAGLFDGEGTFRVAQKDSRHFGLGATMGHTSRELLEHCQRITGFGRIRMLKRRKPEWAQPWEWYVCDNSRVKRLAACLLPWLILKKERAQLILDYPCIPYEEGHRRSLKSGHPLMRFGQAVAFVKMRELNKKGA